MMQAEYPYENTFFLVNKNWPKVNWDKIHNKVYEDHGSVLADDIKE